MKVPGLLCVLFFGLFFTACQKEYTCYCTNPGGTSKAFSVKESKNNAESECKKYYDNNFGSIPWNETTCEIK